jgi:hypothetical protein
LQAISHDLESKLTSREKEILSIPQQDKRENARRDLYL